MKAEIKWGFVAFFGIVIPASIIFFLLPPQPAYVKPQIQSPEFIWPRGCPKKDYKEGDEISTACIIKKNKFFRAKKYGLSSYGRGAPQWYRVNDSLYDVSCRVFSDFCTIDKIERNVFYRSQ